MASGAELTVPAPPAGSGGWVLSPGASGGLVWQPPNLAAGTYANRPSTNLVNGQEYFATDARTSYVYDSAAGAWRISGGLMTPADEDSWSVITGFATGLLGGTNTAATNNQVLRGTLVKIPFPLTIDQMGVECTATGDTTAFMRLGLYSEDRSQGYSRPNTLLQQIGDTAAFASTGVFMVSTSYVFSPGAYWAIANMQIPGLGASPTMRTKDASDVGGPVRTTAGLNVGAGASGTAGTYSPLPTNYPNASGLNNGFRFYFRRSA